MAQDNPLSLSWCSKAVKPDFSRHIPQSDKLNQIVEIWNTVISGCTKDGDKNQVRESSTNQPSSRSQVILIREENEWNVWDQLEEGAIGKEGYNGIVIKCRFQKESVNIPFSAISDALEDIVRKSMSQFAEQHADNINDRQVMAQQILEKELGDDLHRLFVAFPRLCDHYYSSDPLAPQQVSEQDGLALSEASEYSFQHLQVLVKKTIRALSSQVQPIIFIIEDIHLADFASFDLLKMLFSDQDSTSVLYIATFDASHLDGRKFMDKVKGLENLLPLTEIHIGLMTEREVNEMVATVLDLRACNTADLSRVVFQKTGGLYFFAQQFLELVHELNLLLFSLKTSQFEWDLDGIVAATDISDNVADLVVNRIERLTKARQTYLRIAACLGYQFKTDLVALLIENENRQDKQGKSINLLGKELEDPVLVGTKYEEDLGALMDAGLLEKGLFGDTKFTHKRIQDAAFKLNPSGRDRELLHLRLGHFMIRLLDTPQFGGEAVYFGALDQLNRAKALLTTREDKMFLIKQNMQAANIAKKRSAFKVSADYFSHALDLLDKSCCWEEDYDLSLELFILSAQSEYMSGQNDDKCRQMVSTVLEHGKCLEDKIRAYKTELQLLGKEGKLKESIEFGVHTLRKYGLKLPTKSSVVKLIVQITKTKRALRNVSDNDLLEAEHVDEFLNQKLDLMNVIGYHAYLLGDELLMSIFSMNQMRLILKHGTSVHVPLIFILIS